MIIISLAIFVAGLVLLSYGADVLIDASVSLARHLKFSSLVIGLSVIALGTSLPEFVVSLFAVLQGSTEISIGNIIGSNIANVALIIGWTGLFYPIVYHNRPEQKRLNKKIAIMLIIYFIFFILSFDGVLSRTDGLLLLLLFLGFLFIAFKMDAFESNFDETIAHSKGKAILLVFAGIVGLLIGARFMTNSAIFIAKALGIREYVIGATIIAIGTSLPELAASLSAIKKGETGMSMGNIVGSNLFNILMVLGLVSIIVPLEFSFDFLFIDFMIMLGSALTLYIVSLLRNDIPKPVIYMFAAVYIGYLVRLFAILK